MGQTEQKQYTPAEVFSNQAETKRVAGMPRAKIPLLIAAIIAVVLGLIYLGSVVYEAKGTFTIKLSNPRERSISLSETPGFSNGQSVLSAIPDDDMDNITYTMLPEDIDDGYGAHNGDNYIAYTFFLKNVGDTAIDYTVNYRILGATRGIDDAVRMMVIRDGRDGERVSTVYAKPAADGLPEDTPSEVEIVNFVSDTSIAIDYETDVAPEEIRKYTVVVWLEGNDPECIDPVLGGKMQLQVDFTVGSPDEVLKTEEATAAESIPE